MFSTFVVHAGNSLPILFMVHSLTFAAFIHIYSVFQTRLSWYVLNSHASCSRGAVDHSFHHSAIKFAACIHVC